ncbi:hypothetical protein [Streptomyces sp. NBC_01716]|uniref:hypothetical protein n=1 Tax=Streptomyces sp. NBC_01716 TaxID=2975917 RepID=UPI002E31F34A|nr:hypothetical protein [Streptomyces sp. NBC_01716]
MSRFTDFDFGITWLAAMFHRDWPNEGGEIDVLRAFLWDGQDPAAVQALRHDALRTLEGLTAGQIETLWLASIQGKFDFTGNLPSGREWIRVILEECKQWLQDRSDPKLGEVDSDSGFALGSEIKETLADFSHSSLPPHTAEALCDCAHNCSPDLALRFLLRIISSKGMSISNAQYATLLRLGDDLDYGEFLVSEVEDLVDPTLD